VIGDFLSLAAVVAVWLAVAAVAFVLLATGVSWAIQKWWK
jgi:hypothetical protein